MDIELLREPQEPATPLRQCTDFAPGADARRANAGPARLTAEDVARIVKELRSDFEAWAAETELSHEAIEAKLRRERAMGRRLRELKDAKLLHKGGRPPKTKTNDKVSSVSLKDLGIFAHQSSRWQLEASVPERLFELWIQRLKAKDGEISSAALRRYAEALGLGEDPEDGPDDPEFDDVDTDPPNGPCALCGRTCDCEGGL